MQRETWQNSLVDLCDLETCCWPSVVLTKSRTPRNPQKGMEAPPESSPPAGMALSD